MKYHLKFIVYLPICILLGCEGKSGTETNQPIFNAPAGSDTLNSSDIKAFHYLGSNSAEAFSTSNTDNGTGKGIADVAQSLPSLGELASRYGVTGIDESRFTEEQRRYSDVLKKILNEMEQAGVNDIQTFAAPWFQPLLGNPIQLLNRFLCPAGVVIFTPCSYRVPGCPALNRFCDLCALRRIGLGLTHAQCVAWDQNNNIFPINFAGWVSRINPTEANVTWAGQGCPREWRCIEVP